jgi:hypothetical protein
MFYAVLVAALLLLPPLSAVARAPAGSRSSCSTHCGKISIPYPFGVEPGCYHDGGFNLTCDRSYSPPQLYLGDGTVQVFDIDLPNGTVRVNSSTVLLDANDRNSSWRAGGPGYAANGPYFLAGARNHLVALGCNFQVVLLGKNNTVVSSCSPFCPDENSIDNTSICLGVYCCQAIIFEGHASYKVQFHGAGRIYKVLIAESDYLFKIFDVTYHESAKVPAMLTWAITDSVCHTNGSSPSCRSKHSLCHNYTAVRNRGFVYYYGDDAGDELVHLGHNCKCSGGYQGNPYISHGCYGNVIHCSM